jgi:uroporphyrinogen-III synthase
MRKFSDLQITTPAESFIGDKVEMKRIVDKEIVVERYKIETSKFPKPGNDRCLTMQIQLAGEKRVVFSSSKGLMELIEQVPQGGFPFSTTIRKEHERLTFT